MHLNDPLLKIFSNILKIDPSALTDDASPNTIQTWDSMATMALVVAIEQHFSIQFTTADILRMRSIGFVRTLLQQKGIVNPSYEF